MQYTQYRKACNRAMAFRKIWPGFAKRASAKIAESTAFLQFTGVSSSFDRNIHSELNTFGDFTYISSDFTEQPDLRRNKYHVSGPYDSFFVSRC